MGIDVIFMTHGYVLELTHLSLASFLSDQKRKSRILGRVVISATSKVPVWTSAETSRCDVAASHYQDLLCEFAESFRLVLLMNKLKVTKSVLPFSVTELTLPKDVLTLAPVSLPSREMPEQEFSVSLLCSCQSLVPLVSFSLHSICLGNFHENNILMLLTYPLFSWVSVTMVIRRNQYFEMKHWLLFCYRNSSHIWLMTHLILSELLLKLVTLQQLLPSPIIFTGTRNCDFDIPF